MAFVRGTIVTPIVVKKTTPAAKSKIPTQPVQPAGLSQEQAENNLLHIYKQKRKPNELLMEFVARFETEHAENPQLKFIRDSINKLKEKNPNLILDVDQKLKRIDQEQLAILKNNLDELYRCGIETPLSKVSGFQKTKLDEFLKFNLYNPNNEDKAKKDLMFRNLSLCVGNKGEKHTKPLVRKNIELHLRLQKILEKFRSKKLTEQAWNDLAIFNTRIKELFARYKKLAGEKLYTEMGLEYQKIEAQITNLENAAQEIVLEVKAESTTSVPPIKKRRPSPAKKSVAKQIVPQPVDAKHASELPVVESIAQTNGVDLAPPTQQITPDYKKEPEIKIEAPQFVDIKLTNKGVNLVDAIAQTKTYLDFIIENELKDQKDEINQQKLNNIKSHINKIASDCLTVNLQAFSFPQDLPENFNTNLIKAGCEALLSLTKLEQANANKGGGYAIFTLPSYSKGNPLEGFREISKWAISKLPQDNISRITPPASPKNALKEEKSVPPMASVAVSISKTSSESKKSLPTGPVAARIESNSSQQPPKEKVRWKGFTIGGLVTMVGGVVLFFTVPIVGQVLGSYLVAGALGLTLGVGIGGMIEGSVEEKKERQKSSNQPASTVANGNVYHRLETKEEKTLTTNKAVQKNQSSNTPAKTPKNADELLAEFKNSITVEFQKLDLENPYVQIAKTQYEDKDIENLFLTMQLAPEQFTNNMRIQIRKLEIMREVMQSQNFSEQSKPRFIQAVMDANTANDFDAISRNINSKEKSDSSLFKESVGSLTQKLKSMTNFINQAKNENSLKH